MIINKNITQKCLIYLLIQYLDKYIRPISKYSVVDLYQSIYNKIFLN